MRKFVSAIVMALAVWTPGSAEAGHVRIVVAPWHLRPIVVAPRVVAPPPPVAPVGKGFIDLAVTPSDAQVWIDGEYVGLASHYSGDPKYLKLMGGSHTVQMAREGFVPQSFSVVVAANRLITLDLQMIPVAMPPSFPPPASQVESATVDEVPVPEAQAEPTTYQLDLEKTGYLALTVEPVDASLYIDDQPYGIAAEYNGDESIVLREGAHKIQVIRPGFVSSVHDVTITSDATENLTITLVRE